MEQKSFEKVVQAFDLTTEKLINIISELENNDLSQPIKNQLFSTNQLLNAITYLNQELTRVVLEGVSAKDIDLKSEASLIGSFMDSFANLIPTLKIEEPNKSFNDLIDGAIDSRSDLLIEAQFCDTPSSIHVIAISDLKIKLSVSEMLELSNEFSKHCINYLK